MKERDREKFLAAAIKPLVCAGAALLVSWLSAGAKSLNRMAIGSKHVRAIAWPMAFAPDALPVAMPPTARALPCLFAHEKMARDGGAGRRIGKPVCG